MALRLAPERAPITTQTWFKTSYGSPLRYSAITDSWPEQTSFRPARAMLSRMPFAWLRESNSAPVGSLELLLP